MWSRRDMYNRSTKKLMDIYPFFAQEIEESDRNLSQAHWPKNPTEKPNSQSLQREKLQVDLHGKHYLKSGTQ